MTTTANELAILNLDTSLDDYHRSKIECSRAMCAAGLGDWIYGGQWSSMNSWFLKPSGTPFHWTDYSITVRWKKVRKKVKKIEGIIHG
jgi:hypothetical protein